MNDKMHSPTDAGHISFTGEYAMPADLRAVLHAPGQRILFNASSQPPAEATALQVVRTTPMRMADGSLHMVVV
jgi:hypothetical protein